MTLVQCGQGITDIRGGHAGVYFHRDKYGLHCSAKPRTVYRRSAAQNKQRKAFAAARALSTDNRTVSYLMYRYLTGLSLLFPPVWTRFFTSENPDGTWLDLPFAYDGNDVTYATNPSPGPIGWKEKIRFLTRIPLSCSKLRYDTRQSPGFIPEQRIQTIYQGQETFAFGGVHINHVSTEVLFSRRMVDSLNVWFKIIALSRDQRVYEIALYTHTNPDDGTLHYPVPLDYQIPHLQGP